MCSSCTVPRERKTIQWGWLRSLGDGGRVGCECISSIGQLASLRSGCITVRPKLTPKPEPRRRANTEQQAQHHGPSGSNRTTNTCYPARKPFLSSHTSPLHKALQHWTSSSRPDIEGVWVLQCAAEIAREQMMDCLERSAPQNTPAESLRNQSRHCFNQSHKLRRWLKRHVSNISAPWDVLFLFGVAPWLRKSSGSTNDG